MATKATPARSKADKAGKGKTQSKAMGLKKGAAKSRGAGSGGD
jgi:hypothetical protein